MLRNVQQPRITEPSFREHYSLRVPQNGEATGY